MEAPLDLHAGYEKGAAVSCSLLFGFFGVGILEVARSGASREHCASTTLAEVA